MVLSTGYLAIILTLLMSFRAGLNLRAQDPCSPSKKEMKAIQSTIGEDADHSVIQVELSSSLKDMNPGDCIYIIRKKEEHKGYLLSTRALGRYDFFDYSIIYAEDLSVLRIFVTNYRSTHGAAICQKKWLGQFEGYGGETLELGKDIDAVSGGTISATSLIRDIQRCYQLMNSLKAD